MLYECGRFAAFTRGQFPAGRLLVVSGCRALRIHSLKMAATAPRTILACRLSTLDGP